MGGFDPYSNSKACSELVTETYRSSYFHPERYNDHGVAIATARAGNVIGGGDWATDRLVPDIVRSLLAAEPVLIRNPRAIRPWQHVLEPLSGYLMLAEKLYREGHVYGESWNFGPSDDDAKPVEWLVKWICAQWGNNACYEIDNGEHPHEAQYLKLDCSKAKSRLGWSPCWDIEQALLHVVNWSKVYASDSNVRTCCLGQLEKYASLRNNRSTYVDGHGGIHACFTHNATGVR